MQIKFTLIYIQNLADLSLSLSLFFPFQYNKDKYEVKQAKKRNRKGQNIAN